MTNDHAHARLLEMGLERYQQHKYPEAQEVLEQAVAAQPESFDALNLLGVALNAQKRHEAALACFQRAIALKPEHPGAQTNLGMALRALGRWQDALAVYDKVIELQPQFPTAYTNRGGVYLELGRADDALRDYDHSLQLRPGNAFTLKVRAQALKKLRRSDEAFESLSAAITMNPGMAEAYEARAEFRVELQQFEEAVQDFRAALELRPGSTVTWGKYVAAKRKICDWAEYDRDTTELGKLVLAGKKVLVPFNSLGILDTPELQLRAVQASHQPGRIADHRPQLRPADDHIRLGIFSADWERHPTMLLVLEALALLDRSRFHLTAFCFVDRAHKAEPRDLSALFDDVVDLGDLGDKEAAELARQKQIDIAVDLDGHTRDARPSIFWHRPAPLQVGYLGYPGTMGTAHTDYIVADKTVIPPESTPYYSEKIAWLPHSYQPRDRRVQATRPLPSRSHVGLPEHGTVFCCFNANYKITPDIFADWVAIVKRVEGSVLWLLEGHAAAARNLRNEARRLDLATNRLVFAKHASLPDHLARVGLADLIVDTPIYNAHTTASDALYAGVPVLTRPGETFASRVGASLLNAIGMPELIVGSRAEYIELAVAIGNDPARIAALKQKLARNRETEPLFDMEAYARHLGAAFEQMMDRHRNGLPPDHIEVAP